MTTAIVLAAGRGKRMGTSTPKQFLEIDGVPMIVRTLRVFADSPEIDDILLVTSKDYVTYCRREIVEKYSIPKVRAVIEGGAERYDSVWNALLRCPDADYVMIQDGARPFVTEEILKRADVGMREYGAVAVAVPSKDTVKITDDEGRVIDTPDRAHVWNIQTPQAFSYALIRKANECLMAAPGGMEGITDDAMIVEKSGLSDVHLVMGAYSNIKITTPEDLLLFKGS